MSIQWRTTEVTALRALSQSSNSDNLTSEMDKNLVNLTQIGKTGHFLSLDAQFLKSGMSFKRGKNCSFTFFQFEVIIIQRFLLFCIGSDNRCPNRWRWKVTLQQNCLVHLTSALPRIFVYQDVFEAVVLFKLKWDSFDKNISSFWLFVFTIPILNVFYLRIAFWCLKTVEMPNAVNPSADHLGVWKAPNLLKHAIRSESRMMVKKAAQEWKIFLRCYFNTWAQSFKIGIGNVLHVAEAINFSKWVSVFGFQQMIQWSSFPLEYWQAR